MEAPLSALFKPKMDYPKPVENKFNTSNRQASTKLQSLLTRYKISVLKKLKTILRVTNPTNKKKNFQIHF